MSLHGLRKRLKTQTGFNRARPDYKVTFAINNHTVPSPLIEPEELEASAKYILTCVEASFEESLDVVFKLAMIV